MTDNVDSKEFEALRQRLQEADRLSDEMEKHADIFRSRLKESERVLEAERRNGDFLARKLAAVRELPSLLKTDGDMDWQVGNTEKANGFY